MLEAGNPTENPKRPEMVENRVEKDTPRDRDRETDTNASPPRCFYGREDTVFVNRLSSVTTERVLKGYFESYYGKVLAVKVRARGCIVQSVFCA